MSFAVTMFAFQHILFDYLCIIVYMINLSLGIYCLVFVFVCHKCTHYFVGHNYVRWLVYDHIWCVIFIASIVLTHSLIACIIVQ